MWLNDGFFQTVCELRHCHKSYHGFPHILSVSTKDFSKRKTFGTGVVGNRHCEINAFSVSLTILVKMDLERNEMTGFGLNLSSGG